MTESKDRYSLSETHWFAGARQRNARKIFPVVVLVPLPEFTQATASVESLVSIVQTAKLDFIPTTESGIETPCTLLQAAAVRTLGVNKSCADHAPYYHDY